MRQDYEKLFSQLTPPEPTGDFLNRVMGRIQREEKLMAAKRRIIFFSSGFVGSLIAFIPVFSSTQAEVAKTGFFRVLSLIFSDSGAVMSFFNQYLLSLLETLPVLNIILLLIFSLAILEFAKKLSQNVSFAFSLERQ